MIKNAATRYPPRIPQEVRNRFPEISDESRPLPDHFIKDMHYKCREMLKYMLDPDTVTGSNWRVFAGHFKMNYDLIQYIASRDRSQTHELLDWLAREKPQVTCGEFKEVAQNHLRLDVVRKMNKFGYWGLYRICPSRTRSVGFCSSFDFVLFIADLWTVGFGGVQWVCECETKSIWLGADSVLYRDPHWKSLWWETYVIKFRYWMLWRFSSLCNKINLEFFLRVLSLRTPIEWRRWARKVARYRLIA